MIQYLPIEESTVDGAGLRFISCIWVHGHKTGRGNFQGRGMGRALLAAAEDDARARGAKGMAAWGLWLPFWMRASFYKRHGYRTADRDGIASLVWNPFTPDARPPRWLRRTAKPLELTPGKVNVICFVNGWCTVGCVTAERARPARSPSLTSRAKGSWFTRRRNRAARASCSHGSANRPSVGLATSTTA